MVIDIEDTVVVDLVDELANLTTQEKLEELNWFLHTELDD